MQKFIFILLLSLVANFSFAQVNLVPNPSFEDTLNCPDGMGAIEIATGWFNSGSSPDYFNSCANTGYPPYGVPYNFVGHQVAYDGNAYAGLALSFVYSPNYREFIGTQLSQQLTIGIKYFVSASISLADSVDAYPFTCVCNNFGFRFSTIAYEAAQVNFAPVDNFSHVHSTSIISDTLNWTRISGSFIADSTYQYLTIGNFYDDTNTDTVECGYFQAIAYYYVDGICVSTDSLACMNSIGINIPHSGITVIYPNPTSGIISVDNLTGETDYTLVNNLGQIIANGKINQLNNTIDLTSVSSGVYFLKINKVHFKIIITH